MTVAVSQGSCGTPFCDLLASKVNVRSQVCLTTRLQLLNSWHERSLRGKKNSLNNNFQWKLGIAMSADSCKSLKSPCVTVVLKVADGLGNVTCKTFEMTIAQFQNFHSQFKEMASVLETF
uniref:COMM domain-containing protein 6 n=1 Tax=Pseudonaja textilis TaxID=8673 RepID=A0A670Y7R0_PSETE